MPALNRFRFLTEGLKIRIKISGRYSRNGCNVEYSSITSLVFQEILRILRKGDFILVCPDVYFSLRF